MTDKAKQKIAEATRLLLETNGWSLRRAEAVTGVKYSTIQNLTAGKGAEIEHILRFALEANADILAWCDMAEFDLRPILRRIGEQTTDAGLEAPRPDPLTVPNLVLKSGAVLEIVAVGHGERASYKLTEYSVTAVEAVLRAVKVASEPAHGQADDSDEAPEPPDRKR